MADTPTVPPSLSAEAPARPRIRVDVGAQREPPPPAPTPAHSPAPPRTESLAALLANVPAIKDAQHLQHLHCYVYLPYRHWQLPVDGDGESATTAFSADFFPQYEGWRACWVQPQRNGLAEVPGLQDRVLRVHLYFHDGTAVRALLTKKGHLAVRCRKSAPDRGLLPDVDSSESHYVALDVARELTLSELEGGARGLIRHSTALALDQEKPKYQRRVMNIVSCDKDACVVRKIPQHPEDSDKETAKLDRKLILHHCPQMVAEYETRMAKSMTRQEFALIQPYLRLWIRRAMRADLSAREHLGPAKRLSSPQGANVEMKKALTRLGSEMKKKRGS